MRGKYLLCGLALSLLVGINASASQTRQFQKVSPDQSGFTIQSFTNGDSSEPAMLDPTVPALTIQPFSSVDSSGSAKLDPTVSANPGSVAAAPEPRTISMMILGFGCLGALTALRRKRRI